MKTLLLLCGALTAAHALAMASSRTASPEACQRTGCSGELCLPAGESLMSACEWREEFACYRQAQCEKQKDGACGWTRDRALEQCLREKGARGPKKFRGLE
jgi:eight-cysteine-cluster-containing protein